MIKEPPKRIESDAALTSLERRAAQVAAQSELAATQKAITPSPLELGIVLDRSSSMQPLQSTTLEAFNALLAEQKHLNSDATRLSLMLFNHRCETVVENHPLAAVPEMTAAEYQPAGGTALWDGIGAMIEIVGQRFDNGTTPPRVLIVIITDGEETSSSLYTLPHVRELITRRQKVSGWSFILKAPNGGSLAFKFGIPVTNARNWQSDPAAITGLLKRVSKTISAYQYLAGKIVELLSPSCLPPHCTRSDKTFEMNHNLGAKLPIRSMPVAFKSDERYLVVWSNGYFGIANGIALIRTVNDSTEGRVTP